MVNAQLVGLMVSKVGFAVPVNYAKTLLTQHHVAFQTAVGDRLDGPALAKRVSPSVALVTMTCRGGESPEDEEPALHYHGVLDRRKQPRGAAGTSAAPSVVDSSERDDGRLVVDDRGEIGQCSGRVSLPCLLGPLGAVAINPLPADGETTWQRQDMLTITTSARGPQDPLAGVHPRGFPQRDSGIPFGGPFWSEPEFRYPATQQTSYSLDAPKGDMVVIHKNLKLKTTESVGGEPRLELAGDGETVFDLKEGVPLKVTFAGTFTMRERGQTLQVPVSLQCERITGSEAAAAQAPPAAAAAPPPEDPESAKARLDRLLAVLRAVDKDWGKCFQALQGLILMPPVESRPRRSRRDPRRLPDREELFRAIVRDPRRSDLGHEAKRALAHAIVERFGKRFHPAEGDRRSRQPRRRARRKADRGSDQGSFGPGGRSPRVASLGPRGRGRNDRAACRPPTRRFATKPASC